MTNEHLNRPFTLSIVIPCYNERTTLRKCIERVLSISDDQMSLEVIIVDDCSTDNSYDIALQLEKEHREITVQHHEKNQGKGAALRTGFKLATGDFVAVQDADLEYDPNELKKLCMPLVEKKADVVLGSRFLSSGVHRVLYFWHYLGNRFLTLLSNMFSDLNLTDMETCYKVFRREVIQNIEIKENRFGFEPEIVAKVAHMRLRIFEMGISYYGRTYEEGKKIGFKDGLRALYCIIRYNSHKAPLSLQFFIYLFIGGIAALTNLCIFLILYRFGLSVYIAAPTAFFTAAVVNYLLSIVLLFRHKIKWGSTLEIIIYIVVVVSVATVDLFITKFGIMLGIAPGISKLIASASALILNFLGRRYLVFPEPASGTWQPQEVLNSENVKPDK